MSVNKIDLIPFSPTLKLSPSTLCAILSRELIGLLQKDEYAANIWSGFSACENRNIYMSVPIHTLFYKNF